MKFLEWRADEINEAGNVIAVQDPFYFDYGCRLNNETALVKFIPKFQKGEKYKIRFDLQGGTAPENAPNVFDDRETEGEYLLEEDIPESEFDFFRGIVPKKDGKIFWGWSWVERAGTTHGEDYDRIMSIDNSIHFMDKPDDGIEFIAQWRDAFKIKLMFDLQGGMLSSEQKAFYEDRETKGAYMVGEIIPKDELQFLGKSIPKKQGMKLARWNYEMLDRAGNVLWRSYMEDGLDCDIKIQKEIDAIKFTAVWEKPKKLNIEFDLQGGIAEKEGKNVFVKRMTKEEYVTNDEILTTEFDFFKGVTPKKEGNEFVGWKVCLLDKNKDVLWDSTQRLNFMDNTQ